MKNYKNILIFFSLLVLIFVSFFVGYSIRDIRIARKFFGPEYTEFTLIMEAYQTIRSDFIYPDKISTDELIHGAVQGMVNALGDQHTVFFNPEDSKKFLQDADGVFQGVGMEIGKRDNFLKVIAPMKGTPAEGAGILSGDKIIKINEIETKNLSIEESVSLIRGPEGTDVVLLILRNEWSEPKSISITRSIITIPSIEWEMVEGDIAHIKFYHFHRKAYSDFRKIAMEIIDSPAKGIILDMRNNSGGYLDIAQKIGDSFFDRGEVFVIERSLEGDREIKSRGVNRFSKFPIVVLINRGSASASEILAGALRDNNSVLLIGENSFGKGSIQALEYLSDGSAIKITVAHWLTPKGHTISDIGLSPDIVVEMSIEDIKEERDPQLERAIEVTREMIYNLLL